VYLEVLMELLQYREKLGCSSLPWATCVKEPHNKRSNPIHKDIRDGAREHRQSTHPEDSTGLLLLPPRPKHPT
jgi:hypothetical protein